LSISIQPGGHVFDVKPSPIDNRDYLYDAPRAVLPPAVAPTNVPPVRDQGKEGSCWGFAGTAARQSLLLKAGDATVLSPACLYWCTRLLQHDTAEDAGSDLRTGMKALRKYGVATERAVPYVVGDFARQPPPAAMVDAKRYAITAYHRLVGLRGVKVALASGAHPVFGMAVYQGFEDSRDGIVPMPGAGEQPLGGHAILCVGYRDDATAPGGGWLTLHNSWGPDAGDHGAYYLPYAYLTATQWFETWVMTAAATQI
jgi:C1A family cysteine protease